MKQILLVRSASGFEGGLEAEAGPLVVWFTVARSNGWADFTRTPWRNKHSRLSLQTNHGKDGTIP
jgi:hypothetical protein